MKIIRSVKAQGEQIKNPHAKEQGSSLLEVTVALSIAGVGLLSVAQLFGVAAMMGNSSQNRMVMSRAAQEPIERVRALDFAALTDGTTTETYKQVFKITKNVESIGTTATSANPTLKKITITVEDTSATSKMNSKNVFVVYRSNTEAVATAGLYYKESASANASPSPSPSSINTGS